MKKAKKKYDEFVFRFDIYDGSEDSNDVYDGQVVEYEFINQGTSLCVINDGLFLYPKFAGIEPSRVKLQIVKNEMDVTVYKYRFQPLDFMEVAVVDFNGSPKNQLTPFISVPILNQIPNIAPDQLYNAQFYNRLLVISKVKATVETSNPS